MERAKWMPDLDSFSPKMWETWNMTRPQFEAHLEKMNEREKKIPPMGDTAADFSLRHLSAEGRLTDEWIRLSDLRGKPTALIFGSYT